MKTSRVKNRFWSPSLKAKYKIHKLRSQIQHKKSGVDRHYNLSPYIVCLPGIAEKNRTVEFD